MRTLTIKRKKSFVGCLGKMKVYISDSFSNELVISGIPCRKLGELKNGEEKSFEIGEEGARIFVIADKISKEYCNEFYDVPAGQENLYLSGKNEFNPASGNAFRFDNNPSTEAITNRKKGKKKGIIVLCVALIVGFLIGFFVFSGIIYNVISSFKASPKEFSNYGMTVTLTNEFSAQEYERFTTSYVSQKAIMLSLKEEFYLMEGFENYTLEQYANLVIKNNGIDSSELKENDGLTWFEYEAENEKEKYKYFAFVYKTNDAFWIVQFATKVEDSNEYEPKIMEWAKSVSFE